MAKSEADNADVEFKEHMKELEKKYCQTERWPFCCGDHQQIEKIEYLSRKIKYRYSIKYQAKT